MEAAWPSTTGTPGSLCSGPACRLALRLYTREWGIPCPGRDFFAFPAQTPTHERTPLSFCRSVSTSLTTWLVLLPNASNARLGSSTCGEPEQRACRIAISQCMRSKTQWRVSAAIKGGGLAVGAASAAAAACAASMHALLRCKHRSCSTVLSLQNTSLAARSAAQRAPALEPASPVPACPLSCGA